MKKPPKLADFKELPPIVGYFAFRGNLTSEMLHDTEVVSDLNLAERLSGNIRMVAMNFGAVTRLVEKGLYAPIPAEPEPEKKIIVDRNGQPVVVKDGVVGKAPFVPFLTNKKMTEVVEENVTWLLPGRIPMDRLTGIQAQMGKGKSTFLCWLASQVSSGSPWPGSMFRNDPGSVIILQSEEIDGQDLKPRLRLMGGNMEKIYTVNGSVRDKSGITVRPDLRRDADSLARLIDELGDVKLVMVDPLGAFISGMSGNNGIEAREFMDPIRRLSMEKKVATVLFIHPSKDRDRPVIDRGSGSSAFAEMLRMYWYYSTDPKNRNRRVLSWIKGNVTGQIKTAAAVSLRQDSLYWSVKPINLDAQEIDDSLQKLARDQRLTGRPGRDPVTRRKACEWIMSGSVNWPIMQGALEDAAEQVGINRSSFRRAWLTLEDDKRLVRERVDNVWWFRLPDQPAVTEEPKDDSSTAT
jgi:putative DNA primase/helicase